MTKRQAPAANFGLLSFIRRSPNEFVGLANPRLRGRTFDGREDNRFRFDRATDLNESDLNESVKPL